MNKSESGRSSPLKTLKQKIYSSIINDDVDYFDLLENKFSEKALRSQLFTIIYDCYNEAALRNVPLSDKIKLKVEVYLLELYPFEDDASYWSVTLVRGKIKEMRKKMDVLKCYKCKVDQKFLYVITSLAKDIHVLKRLLKSTYDRLPWEEVEFCAVVFVLSRRSVNETNLYCHAYLNVERILEHLGVLLDLLESFGESLNVDKDLSEFAAIPENLRRDDAVKVIRERTPKTTLLYEDFNRLRDIYSLDIIDSHLDLVKSSDPTELCGRLVILRSLQVVGEHLKNTLVTPKLSQNSVDSIVNTMKTYTWQIVKKIRDRISHNILQIVPMVSKDLNLFTKVKHDLEKTGDIVKGLLNHLKLNSFTAFVNKINESLNSDESNEVWDCLDFIEMEKFNQILNSYDLSKTKLEAMFKQINNSCSSKQSKIIIDDASSKIHSNVRQYELNRFNKFLILDNSLKVMKRLKHIRHEPQLQQLISDEMRGLKFQNDFHEVQEMTTLNLNSLVSSMNKEEEPISIKSIFNLIVDYNSAKSIDVLGGKWEKSLKREKTQTINETELSICWKFFEDKLELRNSTSLLKWKGDAVALVLTELYILLKLSYLERKKPLPTSYRSFDKYPRILTGVSLRNHVAHNNIINEILQLDTTLTFSVNAISLYKTQNLDNVNYANMSVEVKTFNIFNTYENDIRIIETQKELFDAVSDGDFNYIENIHIDDIKGRDILSRSLLHLAVFSEKHDVLVILFKLFPIHFLINSQDISLESPLHIAARLDRRKAAEFLLNHGARIDSMDRNGFCPIHTAAASGSQQTLEEILKKSNDCVDEYKTDLDGYTALHLAVMYGQSNLVEFLLEKNANVKELTYKGLSPLCFALTLGNEDLVRTLVSHGAGLIEEEDPSVLLFVAVVNGNEGILEYLLDNGIGETEMFVQNEFSLLHEASLVGSKRLVEILLERNGVDVDATTLDKKTPLHFAIIGFRHTNLFGTKEDDNYLAVIKLLIEKGCSLNVRSINDVTPLFLSLNSKQTCITRLLLESGAEVDAPNMFMGVTALHAALCSGYSDTVNLLLEMSSDINVTDNRGLSPLHFAARCDDNIDTVKLLIKRGLSINGEDNEGNVPLHIAAASNSKCMTSFLLNISDASVNKANKHGYTPLYLAARGGFVDNVMTLVDRGAKINVFDTFGNSPLHVAVEGGHTDMVKILFEVSCDINKVNDLGLSPLARALRSDKVNIVDFLLEKKGVIDDKAIYMAILRCHSRLNKLMKILQTNMNSTGSCPNDGFRTSSAYTRMLCYACRWSTPDVVQIICKSTSVNVEHESGYTPLHIAVWNGDVDIIKILLDRGADITAKGKVYVSPLVLAIFRDELTIVKLIFQSRNISVNDKDEMGFTLLHYAVSIGVESIVYFLLQNGADFHICNNVGFNPIHWATVKGFHNILQIFINEKYDFKADVGPAGSTLLHLAAKHGNTKVITFLIKYEVEVDVKDDYGDTPLNVALKNGHKDAVVVLLTRGAQFPDIYDSSLLKPDIKNIIDRTKLLHLAVKNNNINEVSKCFADGAVLDAVTEESETALHIAVKSGFGDIVKFLLKKNCDTNVKNKCGFTALHLATLSSNSDIVNDLLANGAVYDSPTDRGETPSVLTENRRIKETFKFIEMIYSRVRKSKAVLTEIESNYIVRNPWILPILQNVKNSESATILETAYRSNCLNITELKKLLLGKLTIYFDLAMDLKSEELYVYALDVINFVLKRCCRKDQVVFWDLNTLKAELLRCTQSYDSALTLLNKVLDEQIGSLGEDHHVTLKTTAIKVESLMSSGRNEEALTVLMKIYDKEKSKNDENNLNLYYTMVTIGKALNDLGRHEEALRFSETASLKINSIEIYKNSKTLEAEIVYFESLYGMERYNEAKDFISDIYLAIEKYNINKKSSLYRTVLVYFFEITKDRVKSLVLFQRLLKEEKQYTSLKARIQNNILKLLLMKDKSFKTFTLAKQFYDEASPILGQNHPQIIKIKDTINFLKSSEFRDYEKMLKIIQEELMTAIHNGDEIEVKILLIKGASTNIRDDSGRTPLHWSVIAGHTNITKMILVKEADISIKDKNNCTPLNYSVNNGFSDISTLLIENGAIDDLELFQSIFSKFDLLTSVKFSLVD